MKQCLVDTGALVALLDRSDIHHFWAIECFKTLRPPLITCESVLAETLHLLGDLPPSSAALSRLHRDRIIRVDFQFELHARTVLKLVEKHQDLPMGFRRCVFGADERTAR